MKCLSIRQPWAWLVVHGWKNVENRTWSTKHRGPLLIHASSNMTRADYEACRIFVAGIHEDLTIPTFEVLPRGGIVGKVTLLDCVREHTSPWFTGPVGWVLDDACACTLVPCGGRQGLFEVRCKRAITGVGK